MNAKAWLVKVSLVSVIMAFATVFYLQPQAALPLAVSLGVVVMVELAGFLLAGWLAGFGSKGLVLSTFFGSVGMALVIVLLLLPLNDPGFDSLVVGVFFIQLLGTLSAGLVVRSSRRGG